MKVTLSQTYNFNGKEYSELNMDLEAMTGKELLICERDFKTRNKDIRAVKELEDSYALTVAARAVDVKYGDLLTLKAQDYIKVVNKVKVFLSKGWEEEMIQKTDVKTEETGA